ncbi:twin-arginine translocase subunit TatC [Erythrobacter sp.]|jgi:sec-independent protein translocase protein TatC|uniref:twin-arginine translocase subunit TatC n=1 Tax=Erythrobacter sp. TaxID=1042 RepID=UPI002E9FEB7B|nr:twin-arginine translocase subunit TatC [Erythrobacter sp.]
MAFAIKDIDETRAPLLDHLIELRSRLVRSVFALLIGFAICFAFADPILGFLVQPLKDAFPAGEGQLIFTKLPEIFFVELKVALFAGFMVSFPIIANQLWAFIAPGLYANEKRAFLPFLLATPVLFIGGAALAYYVVMPTAFRWFLGFGGGVGGLEIEALPSAGDYLSLVMQFILAFGLTFLLPVLLMLLHRAGIVTRAQLAGARRYVIVGVVALAAVVTPPDPGSQLILAVPLLVLFEASLLLMLVQERTMRRKGAKSAEGEQDVAGPGEGSGANVEATSDAAQGSAGEAGARRSDGLGAD